jgi:exodeoxyribonuclease VII large subunit
VDITLCDLVADHRAPTPSAAAEAAVLSREELLLTLGAHRQRLVAAVEDWLNVPRQRALSAADALTASMSRRLVERQSALAASAGRLNALSPLATLERGYAVARTDHGVTLASASQFAEGQPFTLRLRDGEVDATTQAVRPLPEQTR